LLPFRDLFAVMFFVPLGTTIDPDAVGGALPWLLLFVALVIAGKVLVIWVMAKLVRLGGNAVQLAIGLGQVGEFSYVLGALALGAGLVTGQVNAGLIGAVVITIAASSVLVRLVHARPANSRVTARVQ
jgi:CPA2 family monovalent cation:H+ antiporter-2